MSSGRRSARRQAVFILYQQDLLELSATDALERGRDSGIEPYTEKVVLGVAEHGAEIDALVERHLEGWELSRLGSLERSILRVAAFELLYGTDVPEPVVIDQAVGSAKRFCSDEAGALINGVLGSLAASRRASVADPAVHAGENT